MPFEYFNFSLLSDLQRAFSSKPLVLHPTSGAGLLLKHALESRNDSPTWDATPSDLILGYVDQLFLLDDEEYLLLLPAWLAYAIKNPVGPVAQKLLAHFETTSPCKAMTKPQREAAFAVARHIVMCDDRGGPLSPRGGRCWEEVKLRWEPSAA